MAQTNNWQVLTSDRLGLKKKKKQEHAACGMPRLSHCATVSAALLFPATFRFSSWHIVAPSAWTRLDCRHKCNIHPEKNHWDN
ncbi:hypothetical protein ACLKA7_010559 [Drosophila subpalustris]